VSLCLLVICLAAAASRSLEAQEAAEISTHRLTAPGHGRIRSWRKMMLCSALLRQWGAKQASKLLRLLKPQLLRIRYRVMGGRLHSVPRTWSTAPDCSSCKARYGCRIGSRGLHRSSQRQTIQPALSQRVSGPPCRAPAVTALLPNRKTEQRLGTHRCSVGRTWRPPLAEIGTGRHAVAIYWPNSAHGALRRRRTVGGYCQRERGSAAPSRGAAAMAPCMAQLPGASTRSACSTVPDRRPRTVAGCSPTNAPASLEPLANLDKHSTHTLNPPPKTSPSPSLHAGPSPTWPSQNPSRLKAIISLEPSQSLGRYLYFVHVRRGRRRLVSPSSIRPSIGPSSLLIATWPDLF
ncbi:hypothetical protein CCMA1212_005088, partial [Trichoderma ghanense]